MIDRYLNDELRESMSANQKDLIEKLMAQPYEERSIEERREIYEQYEKMLKEKNEAESKIKDTDELIDEYAKQGIRASVSINKHKASRQQPKDAWKKKKAKRRQQKQSRRKR